MSHDYANRAKKRPSAARKTTPRGKSAAPQPKPAKRGMPWLVIVSLLLVSGFSFALYQLAFVKPDPVANQQTVKQSGTKTKAKVSPIPKTVNKKEAKDSFDFYKMLPESEVVPTRVEAYKSTPKAAKNHRRFLLQAGSFRNETDADGLRARLILLGMPNATTTKVTSGSGSEWYRVRVGPFASRSKLSKAQDQMVRMRLQPLEVKIP
ncbi:MAG: SPOR domain-containing protein [Motiliproteus sp.]